MLKRLLINATMKKIKQDHDVFENGRIFGKKEDRQMTNENTKNAPNKEEMGADELDME
jgi:hypothetical protein